MVLAVPPISPQGGDLKAEATQESDPAKLAQRLGYQYGKEIAATYSPETAEKIANLYLDTFSSNVRAGLLGEKVPAATSSKPKASFTELLKHFRRNPFVQTSHPEEAEGEKFLAENIKKPGVQVMPSGLQYEVLTKGHGELPTAQDMLVLRYEGTLLDGTVFEKSPQGEPTLVPVDALVPGCAQAVLSMPVGSKWRVWMPARLGYGQIGKAPHITPG